MIYLLAGIIDDGRSLLLEDVVAAHILVARVGGEGFRAHDVKQPESLVEFRPVAPHQHRSLPLKGLQGHENLELGMALKIFD